MSLHDKLQGQAFQWAHNTFPQIRGQLFAVINEVKRWPGEGDKAFMIRVQRLKAIGLVKGVPDLLLVVPGATYAWDAKVKPDKLRPDQVDFIERLVSCAGNGWSFYSLEEFQQQFIKVMVRHYPGVAVMYPGLHIE